MPKLNDYRREPDPPPVRPPTLPPDFPDIPQNPSSELQPPPGAFAAADKVAGTTLGLSETPEDGAKDESRSRNACLRDKINEVLEKHPELRDVADGVSLKQGMHIQVGTPFLDRMHANLQERARAIIERHPDLERLFED